MSLDLILALICALLLGLALTLQKRGLVGSWKKTAQSRTWLAGVGAELVADGCYLGAASVEGARLTVIQPVVVLHFLLVMAIAVAWLEERLSRAEWVAAFALAAGGGAILATASQATAGLESASHSTLVLALAVIALAVALIGGVAASRSGGGEVSTAALAGIAFSASVIGTRLAGIDLRAVGGDKGSARRPFDR